MNTKYTIKNFRVFDEKGVTVDIKPITILTGCNSSGKSSIVKSITLLDTYLNEAKKCYANGANIDLQHYNLNFHKKTTSSLGNFERIINRDSDDPRISYEYKMHSPMLGEDVIISLVFYMSDNDIRKEGKLYSFTIRNSKGKIIYSSGKDSSIYFDFNLIKESFARFILGTITIEKYQGFQLEHNFSVYDAEEWYKKFEGEMPLRIKQECEKVKRLISIFEHNYGQDAFSDIMQWYVAHDTDHFDFMRNSFQKPTSYFCDKVIEASDNLITSMISESTLFYFPLLDDLKQANRSNFMSLVKKLTGDKELNPLTQYGINKISEDFFNSDYDVFIDYFRNKERDVLNRLIPDFQIFMPNVSPVEWITINQLMEDRYYKSASYFLGPGITYFPDGDAEIVDPESKKEWLDSPVTFCTLYDVLMNINETIYTGPSAYYYVERIIDGKFNMYNHHLFDIFRKFVSVFTQETLISINSSGVDYLGMSVVNVKRSYALDGEDEFTSFLHSYFEARDNYLNNNKVKHLIHRKAGLYTYKPGTFLNKWIREFDLGHSISIQLDTERQGILFKIYKDEEDKEGHLIAEEGYGVTQLITLLLRIERAILLSKMILENVNMSNIDVALYSVTHDKSQVRCHYSESNIAIEEPEVHLHPKFQSKLAELFVDAFTNYNVQFIIETHSEYIIRKLQLLVANKKVSNSDISVLYVYDKKHKPEYEPQVKRIGIRKDGLLNGNFGDGFFDEADMLSMFLLTAQGGEDV